MPAISGVLTTLTYLFPWLGRKSRPLLEKRGQRTKSALKTQARKKKKPAKDNGHNNDAPKSSEKADDEPPDQKPK